MRDPASLFGARLDALAADALAAAANCLSGLVGITIVMADPAVRLMPLATTVAAFGGEEAPVVAVQLALDQDLSGQVLLLFAPVSAARLVQLCIPGPVPEEVQQSVLAEVGNVAGSAFVNAVADRFGLAVHVSPPQVVADMAGAVLGSVLPLAEAAPGQVLLIETRFVGSGQGVDGQFILAPDAKSLQRLLELTGRER